MHDFRSVLTNLVSTDRINCKSLRMCNFHLMMYEFSPYAIEVSAYGGTHNQRASLLCAAHYNLFLIHADDVLIELLHRLRHRRLVRPPVGRQHGLRRELRQLQELRSLQKFRPGQPEELSAIEPSAILTRKQIIQNHQPDVPVFR